MKQILKLSAWLLLFSWQLAHAQGEFSAWLQELQVEAREAGISEITAKNAIEKIELLPEVIMLDKSQPEFVSPFLEYYKRRVDAQKVQKGQQLLAEHAALLDRIEAQYGVSKYMLVAFWGMETQYGRSLGKLDVLSSLATLAYDGRRGEFFRAQLLDAMRMIDYGHASAESFAGSWAGAFGNMQFMPTTFMLYAVDGDNDNKIDVVNSLADAFASAANYLSSIGWREQQPVMLEVQLPENFEWQTAQFNFRRSIQDWAQSGVRMLQQDYVVPRLQQLVLSKRTAKKSAKQSAKQYQKAQFIEPAPAVKTVGLNTAGLEMN